jgi:hypothetical protein
MAITGKLGGDFTAFNTAVDQAIVKLKGFETGAGTVETSLTRMADKFTGRRVISEATLMAKAIEAIGGVTKLTEEELAQFGNTAAAAAAKLKLMGEDVPENLANAAKYAKEATSEFEQMKGTLTSLAAAVGLSFSVEKVVGFIGSTVEAARSLRNLSVETGISTDKLQEYGSVTGDLGVSMEELGKAILALQNRIAGGDTSAAGALHAFGLTMDEVKKKSPEQMFETLMQKIDQVPEHLDKIGFASDLFGPKIGSALVKVSHGFDDALESAKRMNTFMGKDAVDAAAKAADNWDRLNQNMKNAAGTMIGPLAEGFNNMVQAGDKTGSAWAPIWAAFKDMALSTLPGAANTATNLANLLSQPGKRTEDVTLPKDTAKPKAAPTPDEIMGAIKADDLKPLTEVQQRMIDQLYDLNKLNEQNAAAFGISKEQMESYRQKTEETIATQVRLSENFKAMQALADTAMVRTAAIQDELNKKAQKRIDLQDAYRTSLIATAVIEEAQAAKVNEQRRLPTGAVDPVAAAMEQQMKALEAIAAKEAALNKASPGAAPAWFGEQRIKAVQDTEEAIRAIQTLAAKPPVTTNNVTMNVNGLLDPRTIDEITKAVSQQLMFGSGRQQPS